MPNLAICESTPLLQNGSPPGLSDLSEADIEHSEGYGGEVETTTNPTPLPLRFLSTMMLIRAMTPLAFEVIFPFVNQMILELGIVDSPEEVGFYSGFVESVFACMSFVTVMPMSYLADHTGRKPIILWGTLAIAISTAAFGMSRTLLAMMISRSIGGAAGSVRVATKTVMAECTDKSNQGKAFQYLTIAYRVGQILGAPLGGVLAHPERNFSLFRSKFWVENPFALPCFAAAGIAVLGVILTYFLLDETLKSKNSKQSLSGLESSIPEPPDVHMKDSVSLREILTPPVVGLLINSIIMGFIAEMLSALFPLFLFTSISSGGMGLNEAAIGLQMSERAFVHIGMLFLYSNFERRFVSTARFYHVIMFAWPAVVCCMPALNMLAAIFGPSSPVVNLAIFIFFIIWGFSAFSWTGMTILVTNASPSDRTLSTINGLAQMAVILPQAVAPATATNLFAFSIKNHIIGGHLTWVVLFIISCVGALHSLTLKESTSDWRDQTM